MINKTVTHKGGCHCKRVRYELIGAQNINVLECSCSICLPILYLHYIVPKDKFKLIKGKKYLTTYQFNKNIAKHYFCNVCGIKSFYIPRSHPNSISVNARCIDEGTIKKIKTSKFDGKNWEKNIDALKNN